MTNREYKFVVGVGYNFSNQIQAELFLPYLVNERKEGEGNFYTGRGFGDVTLRGKYYIFSPSEGSWDPYVELGVVMPTGNSEEQYVDRVAKVRKYMKPYITPGSGVWTPMVGIGLEKKFGDLGLFIDMRYYNTLGRNDAGYAARNPLTGTIGANYLAHRFSEGKDCALIGATFSVNTEWVDGREDRIAYLKSDHGGDNQSHVVGNTGGFWVRLEPGLFFSPDGGNFTVDVSVPFPVYYNVHELQTIEKYGVNITVTHRF